MKKIFLSLFLCLCLLPVQVFAEAAEDFKTAIAQPLADTGTISYSVSCVAADEEASKALATLPFWLFDGEIAVTIQYEMPGEKQLKMAVAMTVTEGTAGETATSRFWIDWNQPASQLLFVSQFDEAEQYEYYHLNGGSEEESMMINGFGPESLYDVSVIHNMVTALGAQIEKPVLKNGVYSALHTGEEGIKLLEALNGELFILLSGISGGEAEEMLSYLSANYDVIKHARLLDEANGMMTEITLDDENHVKTAAYTAHIDADMQAINQMFSGEETGLASAKGTITVKAAYDQPQVIIFPELTEDNGVDMMAIAEEAAPTDTAPALAEGWNIVIEGQPLGMKNAPIIVNDYAMASGQALCHALGAVYRYEEGVLTIGDQFMVFTADSETCLLNGETITLNATPREIDSELFIPVRFLAENLGYKVGFRQELSADGTGVYASIVLIDPVKQQVDVLIPEGAAMQNQILQMAATLIGAEAQILASPAEQHLDWGRVLLASGEQTLIYGNGVYTYSAAEYNNLFHDLTVYLKVFVPETLTLIEQNDAIRQAVTNESGAVIAFPIQNADALEWFYVPQTIEDVEGAIQFLHAYNEVIKAINEVK